MTADLNRVARAIHLDVEPLPSGRWIVTGGSAPHIVSQGACDCTDFVLRGAPCKHLLAVALRRGDPEVISLLHLMVPLPRARRHRSMP